MYFKKLWKGFALLLVVCILAAGAGPFVSRADEVSDLKQSIADKQEAISEANELKKQLQSGLTDVKKVISGLEKSKNNLSAYISELDTTLSLAQAKILELNTLITEKEAEIKKTTEELTAAKEAEEDQYEAMKLRIRLIYERGESMYLEMLMSAQSFGDMINRADYIEELTAYDRRMLEQ